MRTSLARFGRRLVPWALLTLLMGFGVTPSRAQLGGGETAAKLIHVNAAPVAIAAGGTADAVLKLEIQSGWHINANPPSPDYMIATEVALVAGFGVTPGKAAYPPARTLKVGFDESPLSVYDGDAVVRIPLAAGAGATNGAHRLKGTVRFQACNDQVCIAPTTIAFEIAVVVTGGAVAPPGGARTGPLKGSAPATPEGAGETTPAPGTSAVPTPPPTPTPANPPSGGFTTAPPPGGAPSALIDNPIARGLEKGGLAAFLALFVIGLSMNLTPCVYPMIGVTVSIFGARRAVPPLQVFSYAAIYVLGMAVMYSSLGVVAALTGGLFGGLLQNPFVLVGMGLLLIALALSMFGLYELQPPPELLSKLGGSGTTSVVGTFLSGLMVGVFAAPCIGPPVVALLAIVGAKGDPWFGFRAFFTLAMGLGAPYLVLGTFSNLLQRLPRSGEWMVWVKKVFGVILFAIGLFYASLAIAPTWSVWIVPAALILGGVYLGFFEKSADRNPRFFWFKRIGGGAALIAGALIVATTPTPKQAIRFEPFTATALDAALKSGTPVMMDFTANWCAPCHELERFTFTDKKVRDAAKRFRAFRVDLTRYDSPEAEQWRRQYQITGVPTVLFLDPNGGEIRTARVEGFMPAERFLERMSIAAGANGQAAAE